MASRNKNRPINCLDGEHGTIFKQAPSVVALGYPAPYSVAVSSLGAQTIYRLLNDIGGIACVRFFMPDQGNPTRPLLTAEDERPVAKAQVIALSVACETELAGVISLLDAAGLEPMANRRTDLDPPVIIGGPLTFLDPQLVAPLADVVIIGESENLLEHLVQAVMNSNGRAEFISQLDSIDGIWIPSTNTPPTFAPPVSLESLPAKAAVWSENAQFKDLFLVEASRGCPRGCAFCVMSARASYAGKFRPVPAEKIFQSIPVDAPGVGLVGAAVTDHPEIEQIVRRIVDNGQRVSLSSIRADKFTPILGRALVDGGLRTLTIAADGSSQRLRESIRKSISADDLLMAAQTAKSMGVKGVKLYSMIGLPGENDEDIEEFVRLIIKMSSIVRVTIAVQAFVPKPCTPLSGVPMEEISVLNRRLSLMKRLIKGKAKMMPTSTRWSWIDWKLAHSGLQAAHIAMDAYKNGENFAAWKQAIKKTFR